MSDLKTCPGFCCMSFPIWSGGQQTGIEWMIEGMVDTIGPWGDEWRKASARQKEQDEIIVDMLEIDPRRPYHYTCNRFDRKTGSCTRYNERPVMCRSYPNNGPCKWCHLNLTQLALPA